MASAAEPVPLILPVGRIGYQMHIRYPPAQPAAPRLKYESTRILRSESVGRWVLAFTLCSRADE